MTDQEIVAGRGDIAQASGTLGLNVYADFELSASCRRSPATADVGQGSGAVAWLTGNFLGGVEHRSRSSGTTTGASG